MRMMRICGSMPIAHRCACENQTNAKKTTIPHLISPSIYAEMHVLELDLAVESSPVRYAKLFSIQYFIDIDIYQNLLVDIDIDIVIFQNVLVDIDIFQNLLIDIDIDINIF